MGVKLFYVKILPSIDIDTHFFVVSWFPCFHWHLGDGKKAQVFDVDKIVNMAFISSCLYLILS